MPRASSILCLPAALLLGALTQPRSPAAELPVIVNGTQIVQAKTQPVTPPAAAKGQLPVIINYPSAALQSAPTDQKTDAKLPVIVANPAIPRPANAAPVRVAVAYTVPNYTDYMAPVAYNTYRVGSMVGVDSGVDYSFSAPYAGYYGGGYGYGGYGFPAYDTFGPWGYGYYPPLVEVLATGVRPNAGRLTSMPSVAAPVYGHVMGVYYR